MTRTLVDVGAPGLLADLLALLLLTVSAGGRRLCGGLLRLGLGLYGGLLRRGRRCLGGGRSGLESVLKLLHPTGGWQALQVPSGPFEIVYSI